MGWVGLSSEVMEICKKLEKMAKVAKIKQSFQYELGSQQKLVRW